MRRKGKHEGIFFILAAFNFTSLISVGFIAAVALSPLQKKTQKWGEFLIGLINRN